MNLAESYAAYLPLVEAEMRSLLDTRDPGVFRHYSILQYHMGWLDANLAPAQAPGGKRIRPMLCLLACAATGSDPRRAVPAAAGLELLHNFSLIHDDIEDGSATRRHRPTAWTLFGVPQALNAGDAMFTIAHLAFQRLTTTRVPAVLALEALRLFDETCVALTEGQYLDMSFEGRLDVGVYDYFAMIAGKTGALLGVAPQIGALLAGAGEDLVVAYRRFGRALGLAFQLQDDILGIWGDEADTGKPAAGDILSKKKSLPIVVALEHAEVGPELRERYAGPPFGADDLPAILALLQAAGARHQVEQRVDDALLEAHRALALAAEHGGNNRGGLHELLGTLVGRRT